ncbi:F-box protein skip16 [Entophlyctis sp. JEL0112]|nr:F-box protein skip16 [Entophlyctis sp. JEL0112]
MRYLPEQCSFAKVQLDSRSWMFTNSVGLMDTVNGPGVIGEYPILSNETPTFEYCSYTNGGNEMQNFARIVMMEGHLTFVPGTLMAPEGPRFRVAVPQVVFEYPKLLGGSN